MDPGRTRASAAGTDYSVGRVNFYARIIDVLTCSRANGRERPGVPVWMDECRTVPPSGKCATHGQEMEENVLVRDRGGAQRKEQQQQQQKIIRSQ